MYESDKIEYLAVPPFLGLKTRAFLEKNNIQCKAFSSESENAENEVPSDFPGILVINGREFLRFIIFKGYFDAEALKPVLFKRFYE